MSRRIVFAGSAQTRALARIYRGEIAGQAGDDVIFIGSGAVGTEAARSTLMLADILAMEVDEDGDAVPAADLPGSAALVRIPNLYCDFLWPFAGRAHPQNRGSFALPGGPYPGEHGDRFLDQMVAEGVDEDVAIARYLALDIVRDGELDSRLADRMAIQHRLDEAAGTDLAGFIGDRFAHEPLFRTRQRLTMPLLRRLTAQIFARLGVTNWDAASLRRVPFPAGAQPIHPGVIAHFGLGWVGPDQEYPVNDEGYFSFASFCRRYMRFAWNEALHRGIQEARTNPAGALEDLERGLAESPESTLGLLARKAARHAAGSAPGLPNPALIIDEDSYDPELEGAPVEDTPVEDTPVEDMPASHATDGEPPALDAEPEADLLASAAPAGTGSTAPHTPPADLADAEMADGYGSTAEEDLIGQAAPVTAPPTLPDAAAASGRSPAAPHDEPAPAAADAGAGLLSPSAPGADSEKSSIQITRVPAPGSEKPPIQITRLPAPAQPAAHPPQPAGLRRPPSPGSADDGFTDFRPVQPAAEPASTAADSDLIEVLPRLLPAFADMSRDSDRPFDAMPELMPPPPLRPILPPELQEDAPRPGFLARMLGRK